MHVALSPYQYLSTIKEIPNNDPVSLLHKLVDRIEDIKIEFYEYGSKLPLGRNVKVNVKQEWIFIIDPDDPAQQKVKKLYFTRIVEEVLANISYVFTEYLRVLENNLDKVKLAERYESLKRQMLDVKEKFYHGGLLDKYKSVPLFFVQADKMLAVRGKGQNIRSDPKPIKHSTTKRRPLIKTDQVPHFQSYLNDLHCGLQKHKLIEKITFDTFLSILQGHGKKVIIWIGKGNQLKYLLNHLPVKLLANTKKIFSIATPLIKLKQGKPSFFKNSDPVGKNREVIDNILTKKTSILH
jgi:hypothetical protein